LSKIVGMMCPPLFGCRTNTELCRVRGWDKNLPLRLLDALPQRSWIKHLRRLGVEVLVPLWRYAASASAATRSRWQWTWVGDDSVFKKYGDQLGLVGTWWSGQEHRVLSGSVKSMQNTRGNIVQSTKIAFSITVPQSQVPDGAIPD
jgi:hypothetical protein